MNRTIVTIFAVFLMMLTLNACSKPTSQTTEQDVVYEPPASQIMIGTLKSLQLPPNYDYRFTARRASLSGGGSQVNISYTVEAGAQASCEGRSELHTQNKTTTTACELGEHEFSDALAAIQTTADAESLKPTTSFPSLKGNCISGNYEEGWFVICIEDTHITTLLRGEPHYGESYTIIN